jgi:hypothetical protein
MDCEKFESTLLDELYDELDEVTIAAAKRHVSGCARCSSLLSGLKATRRVAVLPIVEPPADLEERIFAAAREAQKVVPIGRRASRAISWAGSWAMRPQTGMAAVFLLMTGISALLLKGKHGTPSAAVTVSEQGEPVPSATTGTLERPPSDALDSKGAATAVALGSPPLPAAAVAPVANTSAGDGVASGYGGGVPAASKARASAPPGRLNMPPKPSMNEDLMRLDDSQGPETSAQASPYAYAPASPADRGGASAPVADVSSPAASAARAYHSQARQSPQAPSGSAGLNGAMASYNAGDYATATTLFDGLASGGDLPSALWAARSTRKGVGCAAAVPRFDQVARAGAGTTTGYDATFEGGQCYREIGQSDAAQTRFRSLLTVTSYVDRAKNELAQMGPKPSAKAMAKARAQDTPPAQAAPAGPQQTPPSATASKLPSQGN